MLNVVLSTTADDELSITPSVGGGIEPHTVKGFTAHSNPVSHYISSIVFIIILNLIYMNIIQLGLYVVE